MISPVYTEIAEKLVRYFENTTHKALLHKEIEYANKWKKLLTIENVASDDVRAYLQSVVEHNASESAWGELVYWVSHWADSEYKIRNCDNPWYSQG